MDCLTRITRKTKSLNCLKTAVKDTKVINLNRALVIFDTES